MTVRSTSFGCQPHEGSARGPGAPHMSGLSPGPRGARGPARPGGKPTLRSGALSRPGLTPELCLRAESKAGVPSREQQTGKGGDLRGRGIGGRRVGVVRREGGQVGCLGKPGARQAGRGRRGGTDRARACCRPWGRRPFDLTTNGLFSISKTGLAPGRQGAKAARPRGLRPVPGRGIRSAAPAARRAAAMGRAAGQGLPRRAAGPAPGAGAPGLLCLSLQVLGLGWACGRGRDHLDGRRAGQLCFRAQI